MGQPEDYEEIATESEEEDDEESDREAEKVVKGYSSKQRILLVGEGDFSFSLCLARAFGSAHNMVATSLDTLGTFLFVFFSPALFIFIFLNTYIVS